MAVFKTCPVGFFGFIFFCLLGASFGNLDVNLRVVKRDVGTAHEFRARRDHRWMLFTPSFAM